MVDPKKDEMDASCKRPESPREVAKARGGKDVERRSVPVGGNPGYEGDERPSRPAYFCQTRGRGLRSWMLQRRVCSCHFWL